MRTFVAFSEVNGGIAQLGDLYLVKAKNRDHAEEILHLKTDLHTGVKYEIYDIGEELKDTEYWELWR